MEILLEIANMRIDIRLLLTEIVCSHLDKGYHIDEISSEVKDIAVRYGINLKDLA